MARFGLRSAVVLILLLAAPAARPEDKPAAKGEVLPIDPRERPVLGPKKAQGPRYLIWHGGGKWHLRTRASMETFTFRGTITTQNGKVAEISNFDDLEIRKRGTRSQDVGELNPTRDKIAFEFRTSTSEDGFDFTVGPGVTALEFDLKIDDEPTPEKVYVGKKAKSPPKGKFLLAADPPADKG